MLPSYRRLFPRVAREASISALCLIAFAIVAEPPAASARGVLPPEATAEPARWPEAHSPAAITDAQTEAKIDELLSAMTLEQKIGQMIQADIASITPQDLRRYPLGSILAGGNAGPYGNERSSAADWMRLVEEFRAVSREPAPNGLAVPILFGVDAVHGHNNVPGATIFPHNVGLGAARDPDLVRRIAEATAREVAGTGIEWSFAPTLAVPQDPHWGRTYEGYSSDPSIVVSYAAGAVLGLQGDLHDGQPLGAQKVIASAKHFLADGGTQNGKDQGDARISEDELIATHAQAYPPAIEAGALTVMVSYSSWNGIKNHGNPSLITDVLKGRMGFDGFVIGDWNGHEQVAGCSATSCPDAVNAGIDMLMAPDSWKGLYEATLQQARDGEIALSRIDDAVRRILRVKHKAGLMGPNRIERGALSAVGHADHLALAREAVSRSLVLLKNRNAVLPIRAGANVLVAGSAADDMAVQSGGWTIGWQGTDVTKADFPRGQTVWEALRDAVSEAGGKASLSADVGDSARPDVAIVVFGETPYAEYQGDIEDLRFEQKGGEDLALLRRLQAQDIPVVSVFLSGRPRIVAEEFAASDAFVAAWLPGTQAAGLADVLVAGRDGKAKRAFTGKLPMAWPLGTGADGKGDALPLGFGLQYAGSAVPTEAKDRDQ